LDQGALSKGIARRFLNHLQGFGEVIPREGDGELAAVAVQPRQIRLDLRGIRHFLVDLFINRFVDLLVDLLLNFLLDLILIDGLVFVVLDDLHGLFGDVNIVVLIAAPQGRAGQGESEQDD
jgi:hypothetical protein